MIFMEVLTIWRELVVHLHHGWRFQVNFNLQHKSVLVWCRYHYEIRGAAMMHKYHVLSTDIQQYS